jgi:ferredoxin-NADP reductase
VLTAVDQESADVLSLTMHSLDGQPLPTALPGQHVVLRLPRTSGGAPLFRSYSLSGPVSGDCYRISVNRAERRSWNLPAGACPCGRRARRELALPGQHVVLRLPRTSGGAPLFRSYSLSGPVSGDCYRISVKIEPNGAAGTYLQEHVRVGDALDVSSPRGSFILQSGERPVVLLSAGIGATPVLAMLHALAALRSARQVLWLHAARDGRHHPFAAEVSRLMLALAHGRSYICYSRPGSRDTMGKDPRALVAIGPRRGGHPARGGRLSLRADSLHGRHEGGPRSLGRTAGADSRRILQRQRVDDSWCRRQGNPSSTCPQGRRRHRSASLVRAKWHRRTLEGLCPPEHFRAGRGVRRPCPVVLPDGRLSQL